MAAGSNCVYWLGPRPRLIITEPNLAKEIMNKDDLYPKPEFESYLKNLFGDGLVTANGEKWFRLRKLANHTFHGESLKVISCTSRYIICNPELLLF